MRSAWTLAAAVAAALCGSALAEDGQWTEVTSLPKGLNVAPGAALSILGIQPGDTLDEVRAVAAELMKEHVATERDDSPGGRLLDLSAGVDLSPPLEEYESGVSLTLPGGNRIELTHTGRIDLDRDLAAWGQISDHLRVDFSAPSSGHQVIGVQHFLDYNDDTRQPRIAPILDDLKARFGANPMVIDYDASALYRWQFDAGRLVSREPGQDDCWPYIGDITQEREIATINTRSGGDCDVVLDVMIATGISDDHAKALRFTLSDNERGRANLTTDFAFFETYVERYQAETGGEKPKL